MDKYIILANVISMTAEQLFNEIKNGIVTIEELIKTGDLELTKRNKINSMLQQLEAIDNEAWERARYGNEIALSDYITKHPSGKHISEAKQKIDFFEQQRKNEMVQKEIILNKLQINPNEYDPDKILELLQKNISEVDLLNCGISQSAIDSLYNRPTNNDLELGPTPESIPPDFTEVYFWGSTGSGKTCALGAVLQMAHTKGYLNIAAGPGYRYAHQLMNIFSDDGVANDYLPRPTPLEKTQYLPLTLKDPSEKYSRSVSLIELSGEIFKCFFDINAGHPLKSQGYVDTFEKISSFLKNDNRKIHFFFVDYNRDNKPDRDGLTQSNYLSAAATYFKNHKIFGKSTDAIFVVLTKSDLLKDENGNYVPSEKRLEYAKNYLNENNYKAFINTLKDICKTESINAGALTVEPFSLGKVYFQNICDFDGSSATEIVKILMDRIAPTKKSILDVFNR